MSHFKFMSYGGCNADKDKNAKISFLCTHPVTKLQVKESCISILWYMDTMQIKIENIDKKVQKLYKKYF